jgi:DtxR family Mn-dependent transcriptional regulator
MPTSTVEDYLKCILLAQEHDSERQVSMGAIAAGLDVAPGTVTAMMKTLSESGLVRYEPYSGVRLTAQGTKLASHVVRRHRLIELFLVEVMHLDWSYVHDEAEQLEHVVSERLIERMDEMLGYPSVDPHGDPIPTAEGDVDLSAFPSLLDCPVAVPLEVMRVGDQSAEFLRFLEKGKLVPGSMVEVTARDPVADHVTLLVGDGEAFVVGYRAASKVWVRSSSP